MVLWMGLARLTAVLSEGGGASRGYQISEFFFKVIL